MTATMHVVTCRCDCCCRREKPSSLPIAVAVCWSRTTVWPWSPAPGIFAPRRRRWSGAKNERPCRRHADPWSGRHAVRLGGDAQDPEKGWHRYPCRDLARTWDAAGRSDSDSRRTVDRYRGRAVSGATATLRSTACHGHVHGGFAGIAVVRARAAFGDAGQTGGPGAADLYRRLVDALVCRLAFAVLSDSRRGSADESGRG